jgi:hypothetical protein
MQQQTILAHTAVMLVMELVKTSAKTCISWFGLLQGLKCRGVFVKINCN